MLAEYNLQVEWSQKTPEYANGIGNATRPNKLWKRFTLLTEQAKKWTKARVYVCSDSVLCLGKIHNADATTNKKWIELLSTLQENRLSSTRKISQEPLHWIFSSKIQKDLEGKRITPENFGDRIIFMSMFNDIVLDKKRNVELCTTTSREIKEYNTRFKDGHWAFLGPGGKKLSGVKDIFSFVAFWIFVLPKC